MTIEQQRDYVRRLQEGWKAASEDQAASARARNETDKFLIADDLQQMSDSIRDRHNLPETDASTHGLVEQQRYFAKLARPS